MASGPKSEAGACTATGPTNDKAAAPGNGGGFIFERIILNEGMTDEKDSNRI